VKWKIIKPNSNIYEIRTASGDKPPCDTFRALMPYTDIRSTDCPKKIEFYAFDDSWWYEKGTNHRLINGCIARDLEPYPVEVVKIESFTDFVDKYGDIVLCKNSSGVMTVIIYDDYLE
jgi:hypothetical protein